MLTAHFKVGLFGCPEAAVAGLVLLKAPGGLAYGGK